MIDEKHMKTERKKVMVKLNLLYSLSIDLLQIAHVLSVQRVLRTQTEVLMGGRERVRSLKEGQREEKT